VVLLKDLDRNRPAVLLGNIYKIGDFEGVIERPPLISF
jgi:hypothetical protein